MKNLLLPSLMGFGIVCFVVALGLYWAAQCAAVVTISEPSAEAIQKATYNRGMRAAGSATLATGQKYAVCLVKLNAAVNQPGDYATLKTNIEAVVGVQNISLLVDGQAPASIPANTELRLWAEANLRIDDVTPPE